MNNVPAMRWKPEYGESFGRFDSDDEGNVAIFYPELERLGLLKKGMSVLSIGGGFGALEVKIVKDYEAKLGFVEPSSNLMDLFDARVKRFHLQSSVIERHVGPFQTFSPAPKYDLVIAIHAWYYVGCDKAQLKKALSLLNPGGTLYIALSSKMDWDAEFKDLLNSGEINLALEDLSDWANALGHENKVLIQPVSVPVDAWLQGDSFTERAMKWMSYIGRKNWDALPDVLKEQGKALIRRKAKDGLLTRYQGGLLFIK